MTAMPTAGDGRNILQPSLEKGRAGYDVAHRSVTYLTYELPFGKGRNG